MLVAWRQPVTCMEAPAGTRVGPHWLAGRALEPLPSPKAATAARNSGAAGSWRHAGPEGGDRPGSAC